MSKVITGQTIYDDFISACLNDNGAFSGVNKPTYTQVINGLLSDGGQSFSMFYDCSRTNPNKCVVSTGPYDDEYVELNYAIGDVWSGEGLCFFIDDSEPYLWATERTENKALTESNFVGTDMSISKNWVIARAMMQGELSGIFDFPGSCSTASLTLNIEFNDEGYNTIARINNLGDREYMELDYNPYLVLSSGTTSNTLVNVSCTLKLPNQASAISAVQQNIGNSKLVLTDRNKNVFNIPASGAHYSGYDLYVVFTKSDESIKLGQMLDIANLNVVLNYQTTATPSCVVNMNEQWEKTTAISNPNSNTYDGVYRSVSNWHVDSDFATMTITLKDFPGNKSFKMYIRSYAESYYDYVMVSQLDQNITGSTSYSNSTLVKAHTRGNQQSGTALSNYTLVEYTNVPSGTHTITVVYRKDSGDYSGDDRGYVLIDKTGINVSSTGESTFTYGSLYIPWDECFVKTFNRTKLYLASSSEFSDWHGTLDQSDVADCFGENDYWSGFTVNIDSDSGKGFTVSMNQQNPYAMYGDEHIYIKVPVQFYSNEWGYVRSYIYVPIGIGEEGFYKLHNNKECALSLWDYTAGQDGANYIEFNGENVTNIGDYLTFYNGLTSESNSVAPLGTLVPRESLMLYNNQNNSIYGKFANTNFMIQPDYVSGYGRLYLSTSFDYKFGYAPQEVEDPWYISIIPDTYNSSELSLAKLFDFWGHLAYVGHKSINMKYIQN